MLITPWMRLSREWQVLAQACQGNVKNTPVILLAGVSSFAQERCGGCQESVKIGLLSLVAWFVCLWQDNYFGLGPVKILFEERWRIGMVNMQGMVVIAGDRRWFVAHWAPDAK